MYFIYTLIAFIPAFIAKSKNYNFAKWWLISTIFWPITIFMIIFKQRNEIALDNSSQQLTNKWIFIAYFIGLCSYNALLNSSLKNETTQPSSSSTDQQNSYSNNDNNQNSQDSDVAQALYPNNDINNTDDYITVGGIRKKIIKPITINIKNNKVKYQCKINNTTLIIKSKSTAKTYGQAYFYDKANGTFLVLSLQITNNGNNPIEINASDFTLLSASNKFFDPKSNLYCNEFIYTKLNPGVVKSGHLVFDIPANILKQDLFLLYLSRNDSQNEIGFLPIQ